MRTDLRWPIMALCLAALAGCRTYVLQGTVVRSDVPEMAFVTPDDPRLTEPGVSNVRISIERDPDKLSREMVGTALSDSRGRFTIPVDRFGAGWMDEVWMIRAFRQGYQTVVSRQRLSIYDDQRLLILMPAGPAEAPPEGWQEQYERFR
jgi:hypothetical protein